MQLSNAGAVTGSTTPVPVAAPGEWREGLLPTGKSALVVSFPSVRDQGEVEERLLRWRDVLEEVASPGTLMPVIERGSDELIRLEFERPHDIGVSNLLKQRSWELCLDVLEQIATVLDALHERGLVHGNLGASSIWWVDDSRIKIPDAALSLALEGVVPASLHYAPYLDPEVGRGGMLTPASDQYSLAVLAYEMIAGKLYTPHHAEGVVSVDPIEVNRFTRGGASLPAAVFDVLQRVLQSPPYGRYDSCLMFVQALRRASRTAASTPMIAAGLRALGSFRATVRRLALPIGLLAIGVLVYLQSTTVRRFIAGQIDHVVAAAASGSAAEVSVAAPVDSVPVGAAPPRPTTGTLRFEVPAGSVLYVDGVRLAGTPRRHEVSAGSHDVNVRLPGRQGTTVRRVYVAPDSVVTVRPR